MKLSLQLIFRTFSSLNKETLIPFSNHFLFLLNLFLLLSPRQLLIYFLSLKIYLFHRNGIIYHAVICDWLLSLSRVFSRVIHIVACVSTSFLFMTEECSFAWIYHVYWLNHQLVDIWMVCTFWLLWILHLWIFMYKFLCWHVIYLWGDFLGHVLTMVDLLKNC